jgi:hypothetical protein
MKLEIKELWKKMPANCNYFQLADNYTLIVPFSAFSAAVKI